MRLAADAATRRTGRQFLLGHADFLAERFGVGLGGLHTLGQIADLLWLAVCSCVSLSSLRADRR